MQLPIFTDCGVLPYDVDATIDEIERSCLVTGEGVDVPAWNSLGRRALVANLRIVANRFWLAGAVEIWVDGSFVEAAPDPRDIDAYFTLPSHRPQDLIDFPRRLNVLEGDDLWTWQPSRRRLVSGTFTPKPPFWAKYRIDIYRESGTASGIYDRDGQPLSFAQAFRQQRSTYAPKGIVRLVRSPPRLPHLQPFSPGESND